MISLWERISVYDICVLVIAVPIPSMQLASLWSRLIMFRGRFSELHLTHDLP